MSDLLGSLISAGANLLGNWINSSNQKDFNQQQIALGQQNLAQQKEFAQNSLSWKIDDAARRGIHPLVALGANTTSFSPVSVGGSAPQVDFKDLGQDLSRAAKAMATSQDREAVDEEHARKLKLENMQLQNDALRSQISSRVLSTSQRLGQVGPPMPSPDMPRGWEAMVSGGRSPHRVGGVAAEDDPVKIKETASPSVKSLPVGSAKWLTYPNRPSAQDLENEYGEGVSDFIGGPVNAGVDALYNLGQSGPWQRWERLVRKNWWNELRGGDRHRYSNRGLRGGGFREVP